MTDHNNCVCGHSKNHHNGRFNEPQRCFYPSCACADYKPADSTLQNVEDERLAQELVRKRTRELTNALRDLLFFVERAVYADDGERRIIASSMEAARKALEGK